MADPFVAEIRIFGFNFPPTGWAQCNGQLLPLAQNTALFSLLGTVYGGNGKTTFALPNLQGNVPMHPGQGPGLSLHDLGETGGAEFVTLLESEMPAHNHVVKVGTENGDVQTPSPQTILTRSSDGAAYQASNAGLSNMAFQTIGIAGSSLPHNNMQPFLVFNFCIALQGIFPPRQ